MSNENSSCASHQSHQHENHFNRAFRLHQWIPKLVCLCSTVRKYRNHTEAYISLYSHLQSYTEMSYMSKAKCKYSILKHVSTNLILYHLHCSLGAWKWGWDIASPKIQGKAAWSSHGAWPLGQLRFCPQIQMKCKVSEKALNALYNLSQMVCYTWHREKYNTNCLDR